MVAKSKSKSKLVQKPAQPPLQVDAPKPRRGRPPIRPNPLDPGIVDRICDGLIEGHSLGKVCEPMDMPHWTMVYRAMAKDENFARKIARARELQQEVEVERIIEMADEANAENWQVVKLRIWARQWRASKLAPKKYGDKQITEVTGADGGPIQLEARRIDPREMTPEQRQVLAGLIKGAVGEGDA